jgi:hypothetical protein
MNTAVVAVEEVAAPPGQTLALRVAAEGSRGTWWVPLGIAVLAILPYLHLLWQPFIADDYIQIKLGRIYGAVSQWPALALDPLYRSRATSIVLTHWTEQLFGLAPVWYYASSLLLHVVDTLMLVVAARTWGVGRWEAAVAGVFFGVYLGHQEAVMWYAALPELLLFLFLMLFVITWRFWLHSGRAVAYAGAVAAFVFALLSKEPAVVAVPVGFLLAVAKGQWRRGMLGVAPLALLACLYAYGIFASKDTHLHLNDGTFSMASPFYLTWAWSMARMLFVWGLVSLIAITVWRRWRQRLPLLLPGLLWMGITLLPFCFLSYMNFVPSRHTYLPSAGLALVVAAGFATFREKFRRRQWALALLLALMVTHHTGYIWTKKRYQFALRAAPTEALLQLARNGAQRIYVQCFPYGPEIAVRALEIMLNKPESMLLWDAAQAAGADAVLCARHP